MPFDVFTCCIFLSAVGEEFWDIFIPSLKYLFIFYYERFILDSMHPVEEHIFFPIISFILLCMSAVSMFLSFSTSALFSFSHSSFACLPVCICTKCFCFVLLCTIPWHCLLSLLHQLEISSIIYFFFAFLLFSDNAPRTSLKVPNFKPLAPF